MESETKVEEATRKSSENSETTNHRSGNGEVEASTHKQVIEDKMAVDTFKEKNSTCIDESEEATVTSFKMPTASIGSKRSRAVNKDGKMSSCSVDECSSSTSEENSDRCSNQLKEQSDAERSFPYTEPAWGGKPEQDYKLEVLKSGVIIDTISLSEQSFYVIGRLSSCHISFSHPTISRFHAVLQYRSTKVGENDKGFYIYDLGSTHGTFWNGNRIKPNIYVRIRGGHMLRFGFSQRMYILLAPPDDQEEESQHSVTELKEMRASKLRKEGRDEEGKEADEEKESDGVDWGMGEDADEETDLQENPYASIADEDLVLDDPKKTLRGWFEREGYDLQYQTEEKGVGQFLCWVDLPMEDVVGRTIRAEAVVKGKKKEAVVQCALEACKILDKYGLLRQANHEARKRKTRNWEAEDYYDSDEDNFLDRTGSVEKKREQRMRLAGKLEDKVETYDSLFEKHEHVTKRISHLSSTIENWQNENSARKEAAEEDALDAFMSSLNSSALTKSDISKMKVELQNLRKEEANLMKLLNLTRPANLPALVSSDINTNCVKSTENHSQQLSSEVNKIQHSLLRRRKEKQATRQSDTKSKSFVPTTVTKEGAEGAEGAEVESEEELDSDDDNKSNANSSDDRSNKEHSESRSLTDGISDNANESPNVNKKQAKHEEVKVKPAKKRRVEQPTKRYDQDLYTENYSTWVPPQDQAGDGKTSLNEKYGY